LLSFVSDAGVLFFDMQYGNITADDPARHLSTTRIAFTHTLLAASPAASPTPKPSGASSLAIPSFFAVLSMALAAVFVL
jgi:hypothetical protein